MSGNTYTRRNLLAAGSAFVAASSLSKGQSLGTKDGVNITTDGRADSPERLAPRADVLDLPEFEEMAKIKLADVTFETIAGGDRQAFDRITLRPRLLIPTLDLDLSLDLFGDKLFAPILIGPVAGQKQFHPDGELATMRGASAGKALMIVSGLSDVPVKQIAAEAAGPFWFQVFAHPAAKPQIEEAVEAGCKAICITVDAVAAGKGSKVTATSHIDWSAVDQLHKGVSVPVLIKGIMTPADAKLAIQHGAQGIVVSNYGSLLGSSRVAPIEALPSIVDAVEGKVPVLVDGSIRRGTDIFKALALGAQGALLARPAMWALSAYGADGVQAVVQIIQSELARCMGMCGKSNLKMFNRESVRIHAR